MTPHRTFLHLILLATLASALPHSAFAGDVDTILKQWKERRHRVRTMRYVAEGEGVFLKNLFEGRDPLPGITWDTLPSDYRYPIKLTITVDANGNRVRKERVAHIPHKGGQEFHEFDIVSVFGEGGCQQLTRRNKITEENVVIKLDALRNSLGGLLDATDYPVLFGHGIVPVRTQLIDPKHLSRFPDAADLSSVGRAEHRGRNCAVLRSVLSDGTAPSRQEFWVDVERDGAIVRWSLFLADKLFRQVDVEYEQVSEGWLPREWTNQNYENAKLIQTENVKVLRRAFDESYTAADFVLINKPGMLVADQQRRQFYEVGADGTTLVPTNIFNRDTRSFWQRYGWYLALTTVALVLIVVVAALRQRRQGQSDS